MKMITTIERLCNFELYLFKRSDDDFSITHLTRFYIAAQIIQDAENYLFEKDMLYNSSTNLSDKAASRRAEMFCFILIIRYMFL